MPALYTLRRPERFVSHHGGWLLLFDRKTSRDPSLTTETPVFLQDCGHEFRRSRTAA